MVLTKAQFFAAMERQGRALTFGDVRLRTRHSEVDPSSVSLSTLFSRRVGLKIPITSAAMDTVTEHRLAIAMARLGGLGIIHKNLTPEQQAKEVARVKLRLNNLIATPITVSPKDTLEAITKRREEKGYTFSSFPVVDDDGKLVGIITGKHFQFCDDYTLSAGTVMAPLAKLITAPPNTTMTEAYKLMTAHEIKALPLLDERGHLAGMYLHNEIKKILKGDTHGYNVDDNGQLRVGAAIGVGQEALDRAERLHAKNVDVLVIDTAHGDSGSVYQTLKELKRRYPELDVVVGNISEADSACRLAQAGADGIKVGQGPGSICTTRIVAGIGCPQVSAVYQCVQAVKGYRIPVCADGGISNSGDIAVAIGAGANSVMLGLLLAGTTEAPGEVALVNGVQMKPYRGMGSLAAMKANRGSRERYSQSDDIKKLVPEGVESLIPYLGDLADVIQQYVGGLRSGMGYVGVATIADMQKRALFFSISTAGLDESHPHHVQITTKPPNYDPNRK